MRNVGEGSRATDVDEELTAFLHGVQGGCKTSFARLSRTST